MSLLGRLALFGLSLVGGGFVVLVGVGQLQNYWAMRGSEPADVRHLEAASDSVELAGRARAHDGPWRSPFTATPTLVAEWEVSQYEHGGTSTGKTWRFVDGGERRDPFRLDADAGRVLVEPGGAQLNVDTTETVEVAPDESPPPAVDDFLEADDRVDREPDRPRRYREARVEPGDDVHVFGPVRAVAPDPEVPNGVDAVVGVEDHEERAIQVGEDDLSTMAEKVDRENFRYVLTKGEEAEAERRQLKSGLFWLSVGLLVGGGGMVAAVVAATVPPFF